MNAQRERGDNLKYDIHVYININTFLYSFFLIYFFLMSLYNWYNNSFINILHQSNFSSSSIRKRKKLWKSYLLLSIIIVN